ncbi:MAG: hypothetical protein ABFD54_10455 [Armatimonadota bacterium]|nr:hypothetical protein [bacterium]
MLTREDIAQAKLIRNRQQQHINETYSQRQQNQETWAAWKEACADFHQTRVATDYLWSDKVRLKIKNGDREVINDALLYLEVDPWYFRSGYLKERLIDALKSAPLTNEDVNRIQNIIINIAGGPNRREFRRFCQLAARVTSPEFEELLVQLAKEHDPGGKLAYLLRYLEEHKEVHQH